MKNTHSQPTWTTVRVTLHPDMADVLANFCHEHNARGVVIDDEDPRSTVVTSYFPSDTWDAVHAELNLYLARLFELFVGVPEPRIEIEPLKQENWAVAWQDNFRTVKIGERLMVTPPWLHPEPEGRAVVIIEPAEAFGTGTHETTQGCLELLEHALGIAGAGTSAVSVLDVGCGSGILAIAAVKLGATDVRAVDNDPIAVESAHQNALLNGVDQRIGLQCLSVEEITEPADVITANLDTRTLLAHRDKLVSLTTRFLIVSGVPLDQWDDLKDAFVAAGLEAVKELARAEWGSGLFQKRG
jgi:ribosomal protein L11 methyltransferase